MKKQKTMLKIASGLSVLAGTIGLAGFGTFAYRSATNPYDVNAPIVVEHRKTHNALNDLRGAKTRVQNGASTLDGLEFLKPYVSELSEEREKRTELLDNAIFTTQERLKELEGDPYISGRDAYRATSNKFVNYGSGGLALAICFMAPQILRRQEEMHAEGRL